MKKILIIACLNFCVFISLSAQDIIIKNDKEEIKAKVIEIEDLRIKYKKFGFEDGPTYNIYKADVFMIIYSNGIRELFEGQVSEGPILQQTSPSHNSNNVVSSQNLNAQNSNRTSNNTSRNEPRLTPVNSSNTSKGYFQDKGGYLGIAIGTGVLLGRELYELKIPYISARYDKMVSQVGDNGFIGIGAYGAFHSYEIRGFGGIGGGDQTMLYAFGVGGGYHHNFTDKFSVIGGLRLNYIGFSTSSGGNNSFDFNTSAGAIGLGIYGSLYYAITPKGAVFLETGTGWSYLNFGFSFGF